MKLPRKLKKRFLGPRLSKKKLKILLSTVEVIEPPKNIFQAPIIKPFLFCPNCGCEKFRGTGNMASYPEHWENFYCLRCNHQVGEIDNSPFYHALQFPEKNYCIR